MNPHSSAIIPIGLLSAASFFFALSIRSFKMYDNVVYPATADSFRLSWDILRFSLFAKSIGEKSGFLISEYIMSVIFCKKSKFISS